MSASGRQVGLEMEQGSEAALSEVADPGTTVAAAKAWQLLLDLRRLVDEGVDPPSGLALIEGRWRPADPRSADLHLRGECEVRDARCALASDARALLELHLPQALCPRGERHIVAILGQSLDGFIATRSGHSRYINGEASLIHLHRLRALSDAVVIGVGTALADSPRLTTRHVPGPHPVRVVIDPRGRLPAGSGLLDDGAGPTFVVRGGDGPSKPIRLSAQATVLHLPATAAGIEPRDLVAALAARGLTRILVEGGGCTVGRFLDAGMLDRLQLAVSPLILGAGRPALPVTPVERLDQALRPACRSYPMGSDVLFDLRPRLNAGAATEPRPC